jgi:hypothetical protein
MVGRVTGGFGNRFYDIEAWTAHPMTVTFHLAGPQPPGYPTRWRVEEFP